MKWLLYFSVSFYSFFACFYSLMLVNLYRRTKPKCWVNCLMKVLEKKQMEQQEEKTKGKVNQDPLLGIKAVLV